MKTDYFSNLHWTPAGIFIALHHAVFIMGLPFYFYFVPPQLNLIIASIAGFLLTGLGVTLGYHRLYAHRAYLLAKPVEAIILFLGTLVIQGSVLRWSNDHRLHHRYVDKEQDPYNVRKGLLYAHVLWIYEKHPPIDGKVVPDLMRNKLVMFQHRHYVSLAIVCNSAVSLLIGWLTNDYIGAFVLCWGVRLLATYHMTWFINSLAHYWGEQSYSKELSARDNAIVALLTLGEGYHNYHHTFPSDYRNGIRALHFDPSKWIIWILCKLGLARELRRFKNENIMQRLITLDTNLLKNKLSEFSDSSRLLKAILQLRALETRSALEKHIDEFAESLKASHAQICALIHDYRELRRGEQDKSIIQAVKTKLKTSRQSYSTQWKEWSKLCAMILRQRKMAA